MNFLKPAPLIACRKIFRDKRIPITESKCININVKVEAYEEEVWEKEEDIKRKMEDLKLELDSANQQINNQHR